MTDFQKYIRAKLILPDMDCAHRGDAISLLVQQVFEKNPADVLSNLVYDDIRREVINRENISTIGIGNGLAFPHTHIEQ